MTRCFTALALVVAPDRRVLEPQRTGPWPWLIRTASIGASITPKVQRMAFLGKLALIDKLAVQPIAVNAQVDD